MDPQTYVLLDVSVTLALFLLGGAFGLGRLFQRVDTISTQLTQLTEEVRRANEIVVALANHRHDVDAIPCSPSPAAAIRRSAF